MYGGKGNLTIKEWLIVITVTVVFVLLVFVWPMSAIKKNTEKACFIESPYNKGQVVQSVLDNRKGMITTIGCGGYYVRFSSLTETIPSHFLGSGGEIQKGFYSKEFMRQFEIKAVK